jgi:hypothetical protein
VPVNKTERSRLHSSLYVNNEDAAPLFSLGKTGQFFKKGVLWFMKFSPNTLKLDQMGGCPVYVVFAFQWQPLICDPDPSFLLSDTK